MSKSGASSTLLFFMFAAVSGMVTLLTNHLLFLLFPMFGLAVGVWKKGGHVNAGIRIGLFIFGAVTVFLLVLFWQFVLVTVFLLLLALVVAPQILLLAPIGYAANLLRKRGPPSANIRVLLLIFCIGAAAYLPWSLWGNSIAIDAATALLGVGGLILVVVLGYFIGIHFAAPQKQEDGASLPETLSPPAPNMKA